jgi:hypothetical protein
MPPRAGGRELGSVALAIGDAERVAGEALLAGDGEHDGGVHAAGKQDDGGLHRPGSSFHSSLCSCIWKRTGRRSATIQSARCGASSWSVAGREQHLAALR